ncbi:hypothetical protein LMG19145_03982 [Xanthomonas arboricola pv. fragariae]|nr:hypothetical protein LMG19145_03982 [Xanthomonas arboricola pv. fragariae]
MSFQQRFQRTLQCGHVKSAAQAQRTGQVVLRAAATKEINEPQPTLRE